MELTIEEKPAASETVTLRLLIRQEAEGWAAYLLEMGEVGAGSSWEEALDDLKGAVEARLDFCIENQWSPFDEVDPELSSEWEAENQKKLRLAGAAQNGRGDDQRAKYVTIPKREVCPPNFGDA